jgi:carbonic anhydrase
MKHLLVCLALALLLTGCGQDRDVSGEQADDVAGGQDEEAIHSTEAEVHWGYGQDNGPAHWGKMNAAWSTCATGMKQSPIDIANAMSGDKLAISMNFEPADLQVVHQEHALKALDNGHTIQVNYDGGENLALGEQSYRLLQFHFHSPSEHTVDGEHYPMEMHLVHQSESGELAVIGVFIEEGAHNQGFDDVWQNLPDEKGEKVHLQSIMLNVDNMLPENGTNYRYHGSLTSPPCSEGVGWIVMTDPIQFDAAQIAAFQSVFTGNNRPTQPLNDRDLVVDNLE